MIDEHDRRKAMIESAMIERAALNEPASIAPLFDASTGLRKVSDFWFLARDGNPDANALFARHYSRRAYADGRPQKLFVGPGEKLVLIDANCTALFVWRKFIDGIQPPQEGVNCAVFRNESSVLSSALIVEAMVVAWQRWPGTRFYTLVNAGKIRSTNPGACFLKAGWKRIGASKGGLVILAHELSHDARPVQTPSNLAPEADRLAGAESEPVAAGICSCPCCGELPALVAHHCPFKHGKATEAVCWCCPACTKECEDLL